MSNAARREVLKQAVNFGPGGRVQSGTLLLAGTELIPWEFDLGDYVPGFPWRCLAREQKRMLEDNALWLSFVGAPNA